MMKNIRNGLLLITIIALNVSLAAQKTPEALLGQLPAVPTVKCDQDRSEIDNFVSAVYAVKAELQTVIDQIHANEQARVGKMENKLMTGAASHAGLSRAELDELQETDGEDALARKAAEKTISSQYNLSMAEIENLSEMSEAEQEQWAQQYADQQMQSAQQNPQAGSKKQDNDARLFRLSEEQKEISERITDRMTRVAGLLKEVDQAEEVETGKLNQQLVPLENQLCSGICTDAEVARSNAAEKQIYALRIRHCQKLSPLQSNALSQYLTTVKSLFPDYRRLAEVQNETAKLQNGISYPIDLSCYSAVDEYASALLDAYRFWVGKFE